MVVRDSLFDVLLFGVLALALVLDQVFSSQLHGMATVLAVGLVTYCAAQELSRVLARRQVWTQESLATSVALSALGFLYYWRYEADIVLVMLSLIFMMTSLMMLIAIVAALGAAWHDKSGAPILGWITTFGAALFLGVFAGVLILVLTSDLPLGLRFALLAVGFALAKMRAMSKPTPPGDTSSTGSSFSNAETTGHDDDQTRAATVHAGGWTLLPERGTLLERFAPVLVVGALAFVFLGQTRRNADWSGTPAQAAPAVNSLQNSVSAP